MTGENVAEASNFFLTLSYDSRSLEFELKAKGGVPSEWTGDLSSAGLNEWLTVETETRHVTVRQFFSSDRRVKDKQRYLLKWDEVKGSWGLHTLEGVSVQMPPTQKRELNNFFDALDEDIDRADADRANEKIIAVLLESPHKDEYSDEMVPRGPARGTTGIGFQLYFVSHVLPMLVAAGLRLETNLAYRIYMVNPVPYQASLGRLIQEPPAHMKSKIWETLWHAGCQNEFEERMKIYKPHVVLNGCTTDTKQKVTDTVVRNKANFKWEQHFNIAHPSGWQKNLKPFGEPDSTHPAGADHTSPPAT